MNAIRCGIELAKFHIDSTHTHVGIALGQFTITLIGGYQDQSRYLLHSNCLESLGNCLELAGQEELVVTADVFKQVEKEFQLSSSIVIDQHGNEFYKIVEERNAWQVITFITLIMIVIILLT